MSGFAIEPKTDCPHQDGICGLGLTADEIFHRSHESCGGIRGNRQGRCLACHSSEENWLCMSCFEIHCSREVQGHMVDHHAATGHPLVFSLSDASFWCYECDSYVTSMKMRLIAQHFGSLVEQNDEDGSAEHHVEESNQFTHDEALDRLQTWADSFTGSFTKDMLLEGLAAGSFKKIAVLTGAGISVAAGIPDFRTPGTGLYSKVAAMGMSRPEEFFSLEFFRNDPQPFYSLAHDFLTYQACPVQAHYFVKKLADDGNLLCQYTQNIDGLELLAGVPHDKLVQAHGHMRTARCIACRAEAPIEDFNEAIRNRSVLHCKHCELPQNYIKPDIVFFGEGLPADFFQKAMMIDEADLLIIMGTSLRVAPFSLLPQFIERETPVVVINRENVIYRDNSLFLSGDIETEVIQLARALGWTLTGAPETEQM